MGQSQDFQAVLCTSVLLACAVSLVNYNSIASKYWIFFSSSSIPSKGKCLYNFSARSEKTVYLNALKCSASLNNLVLGMLQLGIFRMAYRVLGSGESVKWGWMVWGKKPIVFKCWNTRHLPWQGNAVSHCYKVCVLAVQLSGRPREREQVSK